MAIRRRRAKEIKEAEVEQVEESTQELEPSTASPFPETPTKVLQTKPVRSLEKLDPQVELRVYLATCGDKPDQVAGFAYWAKKHGPDKCSIRGWRAMRKEFNARPV